MLRVLRVKDFAIIAELELTLGPGLNVVTGETGAGKSIMVAALQLVLGARGSASIVREGASSAVVEALFEVTAPRRVAALEEAGVPVEDGEVLIRRVIAANGRTRAYVNGQMTTARTLRTISAGLADICSQHEHHTLADPTTHLDVLDSYAKTSAAVDEVRRAYDAAQLCHAALSRFATQVRDADDRVDYLRFQLNELSDVVLEPKAIAADAEELGRLQNVTQLAELAGTAETALYSSDGSICEQLGVIASDLRAAAELDGSMRATADQLEEASASLEDVGQALSSYVGSLTVDPGRLEALRERKHRLDRLIRKHGGSVEGVALFAERAQAELADVEGGDERLAELERALSDALSAAERVALALRSKREKAAKRFGKEISKELGSLGMGDAKVSVEVEPLSQASDQLAVAGARLTARGIDRAELLIAPNPGEPARPLVEIASGGELSRSLLAIKRVLGKRRVSGLYVFDEVDSGVGGAVAEVIGRKLGEVAEHQQVLCITHLPQISVFGEQHFFVSKRVVEGRTQSEVRLLNAKEREAEIARMLGGVEVSKEVRAAAKAMLRRAR